MAPYQLPRFPVTILLMDSSQPNFDFIMNPSKGSNHGGSISSKKQRIIIFAGGIVLVLIATIIISSLISANTGKAGKAIVDLAAYQTELKRVIGLGNDKTRDATLHNKSITASYTLESDYQQTVKMLNARKIKPGKDFATKYAGQQTDQLLDAADKSNNFDAKYEEVFKEKLTKYKAKLAEVYPLLAPNEKQAIKSQSDHVKILLGEPTTPTAK